MVSSKFSHIENWIFDVDHTLYDPEYSFEQEQREMFYAYLARKDNTTVEVITERIELLAKDHFDPWAQYVRLGYPYDQKEWEIEVVRVNYARLPQCHLTRQLLAALPGKKYLFTNHVAVHAQAVLKQLQLNDLFDGISDAPGRNYINKPDDSIYTELVQRFNLDPTKSLFVEDSPQNLQPAFVLGMSTVLVHRTDLTEVADFVQHQYPTLLDFLQEAAQ